jgi:sigma-E factor negative regulatory protein RseA
MNVNAQEQVSALLDGELPEAELPMAIRRMARDPELGDLARRYSLIGDALRDELPPGRPAELVARVRAALAGENATATAARPAATRGFARIGAGFAVAASVAMVALLALPGRQLDAPPPVISATEIASPAPEQRMMIQPVYTRAAGGGPDRLTRYYVNHSEFAPPVGGRSVLTRIIVIQPEAAVAQEDAPEVLPLVNEEPGKAQ